MPYSAAKIFVTCDVAEVRKWADFMIANLSEVKQSLLNEGALHEAWFLGEEEGAFYVIGVMDVADEKASAAVAAKSKLSVDEVHRNFKQHWDRDRSSKLEIDPLVEPSFRELDLLFEARVCPEGVRDG